MNYLFDPQYPIFDVLNTAPIAVADILGSSTYPNIFGTVRFYRSDKNVLVYAEIRGLPKESGKCKNNIFGFHIHEGASCSGNDSDPFMDAMGHYNPNECEHPNHAGDMPPLFGNDGFAMMIFLTDRFKIEDVIGKAVIIHDRPDDFTTQPSGNSGTKIACGIIKYRNDNAY